VTVVCWMPTVVLCRLSPYGLALYTGTSFPILTKFSVSYAACLVRYAAVFPFLVLAD
jgi:hypothetical protein